MSEEVGSDIFRRISRSSWWTLEQGIFVFWCQPPSTSTGKRTLWTLPDAQPQTGHSFWAEKRDSAFSPSSVALQYHKYYGKSTPCKFGTCADVFSPTTNCTLESQPRIVANIDHPRNLVRALGLSICHCLQDRTWREATQFRVEGGGEGNRRGLDKGREGWTGLFQLRSSASERFIINCQTAVLISPAPRRKIDLISRHIFRAISLIMTGVCKLDGSAFKLWMTAFNSLGPQGPLGYFTKMSFH